MTSHRPRTPPPGEGFSQQTERDGLAARDLVMNWRYRKAAYYRAEAKRVGQTAKWYARHWPDTERARASVARLAETARDYRRMASELEA